MDRLLFSFVQQACRHRFGDNRIADFIGDLERFINTGCQTTARHGHPIGLQDLFGFMLGYGGNFGGNRLGA